MIIRDALPSDEQSWRRLWAAYNAFYETTVPEAVTAATWRRILDPASPIFARIAELEDGIAGFSVSVLHEGTWTIAPICYIEDLFVEHSMRGRGLGHALIDDLITLGRERGWSRLYWHTGSSNIAARRLYDGFIKADDFVRYRLFLEE